MDKIYYSDKHTTLYKGDCLEVMQELIDNNTKVDMILTDPPYILDNHGGCGGNDIGKRACKIRDEIEFIANGFDYESCFNKLLLLQDIPNMIIFCSNQQLARTMLFFENKGLSVKCLVWNKSNPSPLCNGKHIEDIEYVVYVRGKNATWNNEVPLSMKYKVKKFPFVNPKERLHPTQKPIKLLEEYILLHSKENDTILDCFSGSGSTLEACKNLGRKSIGIEIEEKYCEITRVRLGSRNELFD